MGSLVTACRLSIYPSNADVLHHRAISGEILHRAHRAGLLGATTLQGVLGYGHSAKIHSAPTWRLTDRTPITIHLIDSTDRIPRLFSSARRPRRALPDRPGRGRRSRGRRPRERAGRR